MNKKRLHGDSFAGERDRVPSSGTLPQVIVTDNGKAFGGWSEWLAGMVAASQPTVCSAIKPIDTKDMPLDGGSDDK